MSNRFDLETALAAWRRSLTFNRAFDAADLDELERHVRDQVEALVQRGVSEEEAFHQALREMGRYGAVEAEYRKVYWGKRRRRGQVLPELTWRLSMLKNYLKIAWRNALREKGYAFINVFGLAVGIAFCTLIFLFVRDELTYDHFHTDGDRIYRVQLGAVNPDGSRSISYTNQPIPLGPALQADLPDIEQYVRLYDEQHYVRPAGGSGEAHEETILFADPSILQVFTFPLQQGDPTTALADPGSVVLTEAAARKHFGEADPMGQILQIRLDQTFEDFVVTGVTDNIPGNSTIQFGLLLPFQRLLAYNEHLRAQSDYWGYMAFQTYVTLTAGTTAPEAEAKLPAFWAKYHQEDIARLREQGRWNDSVVPTYHLQPLRAIHLESASSPLYSYILSGIALAVLVIACINFMTLSLGRSARRAKEVGVRKVVGAGRKQVMAQFWGEALLLSGIALLLGLLLAAVFLPVFNTLTGKSLHFDVAANWTTGAMLVGLVLVTGLGAGSYPALVLSGFQPIETLTNRLRLSGSNTLTKSLVVLQFALSMFLITSTLIMTRQLAYTRSMELGFDKEQIVVIPLSDLDGSQIAERFRTELSRQPNIVDVTATSRVLGLTESAGARFTHEGNVHTIDVFSVEANYLDFFDCDLVSGRNFDPGMATDTTHAVLVNEALVRDFGLTDPIGSTIPGLPVRRPEDAPHILGVVEDHHFQSLYKEIEPMMLTLDPGSYRYLLVRIRPTAIPQSLDLLKTTWQHVAADVPFAYRFLDDDMQAQYRDDQRWSQIIQYAALFAVLISCLGLLGLAALSVTRRTKEIGIRKVLGATVPHVVVLIAKDFVLLVALGVVLAAPAAYMTMHRWLGDFAYRIDLSTWIFLLAGLLALGVALLTVSYQAIKAALADPVKSLRYE